MIIDGTQALSGRQAADWRTHMAEALRLVPFHADGDSLVRLCVAMESSGGGWRLIGLRSFAEGRVYLGALADRGGRVREWLEIWIQTVAGPGRAFRSSGAQLDNASLDRRWREMVEGIKAVDPDACIDTGFESRHPPPTWIDPSEARMVISPAPGANDAATDALLPLNPEGGLLFVRRRAALKLEDYAGFLSGSDLQGYQDEAFGSQYLGGLPSGVGRWDFLERAGPCLLPTSRGKPGRFLETFHHKLLLFSKMVKAVRDTVAARQLPMLNLAPSSFRVDFAGPSGGLPLLWTARVSIATPPAAVPLPLPQAQARYFRALEPVSASIYRTGKIAPPVRTSADVRIRRSNTEQDATTLECTVNSSEPLRVAGQNLVRLEIPLPGAGCVDVFGRLDAAQAMAGGECRFTSEPMTLPTAAADALLQSEGRAFMGVPLETVPLMGAPCDLYALGVLGVQLFLASSGRRPLAVALDEVLSLARAMDAVELPSPGARAKTLALGDPRWNENLGPQHHGHGCASAEEAFSWVPVELWWDVMAVLARFFPGAGGGAFLRDYEDVPPDMSRVFGQPLMALDRLVQASQSLLLSDWVSNREIARIIQEAR